MKYKSVCFRSGFYLCVECNMAHAFESNEGGGCIHCSCPVIWVEIANMEEIKQNWPVEGK
jgi:hypothetical protein